MNVENTPENVEGYMLEFMDMLNTIELSAWMASIYGEPVRRAMRRCCKAVAKRLKYRVIRAIALEIGKSKDPIEMCCVYVADVYGETSIFTPKDSVKK